MSASKLILHVLVILHFQKLKRGRRFLDQGLEGLKQGMEFGGGGSTSHKVMYTTEKATANRATE